MALSNDNITDINVLTQLSTHISNILDKESTILLADRTITPTNITALNDVYEKILLRLNEIINAQIGLP